MDEADQNEGNNGNCRNDHGNCDTNTEEHRTAQVDQDEEPVQQTMNLRHDRQQCQPLPAVAQPSEPHDISPLVPELPVSDNKTLQCSGESQSCQVNISCLNPASLMCVPLKINLTDVLALIDSGAGKSLCRIEVLVNTGINLLDREASVIKGLGKTQTYALGHAKLPLNFFGVPIDVPVIVVADDVIQYDLILGYAFLHDEKISVDMNKRAITKVMKDNSSMRVVLDENNSVRSIMVENVPAYATKSVRVREAGTTVPIVANFCSVMNGQIPAYFFEGKESTEKQSLDGIFFLY